MKKRKKKNSKKIRKIIMTITILLILLILTLIIYENFIDPSSEREIKKIELKDECSLMFDNILHNIKTAGNCESQCKNECSSRTMIFDSSNFTQKEGACHECDCYCK